MEEIWKQLAKKGELTTCTNCGKRIYKFWFVKFVKRLNNRFKREFPEMDKCAPCYFNNPHKETRLNINPGFIEKQKALLEKLNEGYTRQESINLIKTS